MKPSMYRLSARRMVRAGLRPSAEAAACRLVVLNGAGGFTVRFFFSTAATRAVIRALKEYGNHVPILTKGDGSRDFDLLDGEDWYGVTISCDDPVAKTAEPGAVSPASRLYDLEAAKCRGIRTWVSFEPVLDPAAVLDCIKYCAYFVDRVKIGKLNYHTSDIDWAKFGREAVAACEEMGLDCYIKESLRAEMDKQ